MSYALTDFMAQYGYLAVLAGSMLEGETVLLLAGFAAHQGYLSFPLVAVLAFCGGGLNDQVFFFLGRRYGRALFNRFPSWQPKIEKVHALVRRFHSLVIVMIRFLYGLRIVGPIIIGTSGIPPWRFLVFNMIGAAIWAVLLPGVGYFLGEALTRALPHLAHYEALFLLLLAGTALVIGLAHRLLRGLRKKP